MKKLRIELKELVVQFNAENAEGEILESWNVMFKRNPQITVEDRQYDYADFGTADGLLPAEVKDTRKVLSVKDLLDEYWLTDKTCVRGVMVGGQGSAQVVIDLDDDAVFDPKQGCFIVSRLRVLDRNLPSVITGFWYDGKIYAIEDGKVEQVTEKRWVWSAPEEKTVYLIKTPTKKMDEVLSTSWEKLPVLIFRTRNIAKWKRKFPREMEVEVMPWNEKEGVTVVTDYDAGGRPYVELDTLWRGLDESLGSKELNYPDCDSGYRVMMEMSIDVADETLLYFKGKLHEEQRMWFTVAAVWPKSMDGCCYRPQTNRLLIRQLDYIGMNSDSQQMGTEEEKFGNTSADYLLVDGKMCRIPPTYVDAVLAAVASNDGTGVKVEDERGERLVPESYLDLVKLGSEEEVPELEVRPVPSYDDDDDDDEDEDDEEDIKYGFINKNGEFIIKPKFDGAGAFNDGAAWVELNGKWGYIDKSGAYIVEPKFDGAGSFSDGIACVCLNGKKGFIDKSGAYIVEPEFDGAGDFRDGAARVELNGKWGYIDKSGAYIVEPKFDGAEDFCDGAASVLLNGKWGYIDKSGAYIVEPKFDRTEHFSEGAAPVKLDDKWGYIDRSGAYIVEPKFDDAGDFSEGAAPVKLNGKWGYIDKNGAYIAEPKFDGAEGFCDGAACVELNGKGGYFDSKYGYIDKSGAYIVEPKFDYSYGFCDGAASVRLSDEWGYIDKGGAYIVEPKFDHAYGFCDGAACVILDGKWGYIDKSGEFIVEPKFGYAGGFCDGLARVGIKAG